MLYLRETSGLVDWIATPLRAVQGLLDTARAGRGDEDELPRLSEWAVPQTLQSLLVSEAAVQQIPLLTQQSMRDGMISGGTLVRYHGMVQDMYPSEYFAAAVVEHAADGSTRVVSAAYQDSYVGAPDAYMDEPDPRTAVERMPAYCVPIPGQTAWANGTRATATATRSNGGGAAAGTDATKRRRDDDNDEHVEEDDEPFVASPSTRRRVVANGGKAHTAAPEPVTYDLNFPIKADEENGLACLVFIIGGEQSVRLNEVYEFIGVYGTDTIAPTNSMPAEQELCGFVEMLSLDERRAMHPPSSIVPRVHCILRRKIEPCEPILRPVRVNWEYEDTAAIAPEDARKNVAPVATAEMAELASAVPGGIHALRNQVINALAVVLGGDVLAAEFLLLHLMSRNYHRIDGQVLGKLSLNLSGLPSEDPDIPDAPEHGPEADETKDDVAPQPITRSNHPEVSACSSTGKRLFGLLSQLVPRVAAVPLTKLVLSNHCMSPRKDYASNRLVSGPLQVSKDTNIIFDETVMSAGRLNATAVKNLREIQGVSVTQMVPYDFGHYPLDFPCDIAVLILSIGKCLVATDCQVPIVPTPTTVTTGVMDDAAFALCRRYLAASRYLPFDIDAAQTEQISTDFAAARAADATIMQPDMHRWLTLARLVAISFGESTLTNSSWRHTLELDTQRRARLPPPPAAGVAPPTPSSVVDVKMS